MDDVSARSVQPAVLELFWALASIETDAREVCVPASQGQLLFPSPVGSLTQPPCQLPF